MKPEVRSRGGGGEVRLFCRMPEAEEVRERRLCELPHLDVCLDDGEP